MPTKKKPAKPKRQNWLGLLVAGILSGVGALESMATPENIQWLLANGGRVFAGVATVLSAVHFVQLCRKPRA